MARREAVSRGVHRLVCEAFRGAPPTAKHVAAHRDGNGMNNAVDNLRWATPLENEHDKSLHGTVARGERQGNSKLTTPEVVAIRRDPRPYRQIARDYGVTPENIAVIVRRDGWKHVA